MLIRHGREGTRDSASYDGKRDNGALIGTLLWQRSICHPGGIALSADVLFDEVLDPDPAVGLEHWAPDDGHGQCYRLVKGSSGMWTAPCGCTQRCRAGNSVDPSRRYSEEARG